MTSIASARDQRQNFFRKGDYNAAGNGQHPICPLARIMAFEGKTHLQDAEAQQDQTHRADQGKDELAQIINNLQRVTVRQRGGGEAQNQDYCREDRKQSFRALVQ